MESSRSLVGVSVLQTPLSHFWISAARGVFVRVSLLEFGYKI